MQQHAFVLQVAFAIIVNPQQLVFYIRLCLGFISLGILTLSCGLMPYVKRKTARCRCSNVSNEWRRTQSGKRRSHGNFKEVQNLLAARDGSNISRFTQTKK